MVLFLRLCFPWPSASAHEVAILSRRLSLMSGPHYIVIEHFCLLENHLRLQSNNVYVFYYIPYRMPCHWLEMPM